MGENRRKAGNDKPRGGKRSTSFKPGQPSANPKGRPKKDFDLVTRCRALTPAIIEHYAKMGAKARSGPEVLAGKIVIEYGFDKPKQRTELTGPNGSPLVGPAVTLYLPDDGSRPDASGMATTTTTLDVRAAEVAPSEAQPPPSEIDAGSSGDG